MLVAPDAHNKERCPIWDGVNIGGLPDTPEVFFEGGNRYYSARAGGPFRLMQSGAALLALGALQVQCGWDFLPVGQKANLSYWIYQHNLENRLLDELTDFDCLENGPFENWMDNRRDRVLELNQDWVEGHLDRTPSAEDRMLTFLRELIRCNDAGKQSLAALLMAASGCRHDADLKDLRLYALDRGWLRGGGTPDSPSFPYPDLIELDLGARMYVEERTRELDQERQAVVPDPAKNESEFLNREFTISNIQNLPIEEQVVPIVEARLNEARIALDAGAHLSVIFLCGSVLEGVLLGAAHQDPANFNKAKATPKTEGSPKSFPEWSLAQLIDVACEIEVLKPDVKQFGHGLRDFRNYIHPYKQMDSGFTPDEHTAKVCIQVLKAALASLAGER